MTEQELSCLNDVKTCIPTDGYQFDNFNLEHHMDTKKDIILEILKRQQKTLNIGFAQIRSNCLYFPRSEFINIFESKKPKRKQPTDLSTIATARKNKKLSKLIEHESDLHVLTDGNFEATYENCKSSILSKDQNTRTENPDLVLVSPISLTVTIATGDPIIEETFVMY